MKPLLSIFVFVAVLAAVWQGFSVNDTSKLQGEGGPNKHFQNNTPKLPASTDSSELARVDPVVRKASKSPIETSANSELEINSGVGGEAQFETQPDTLLKKQLNDRSADLAAAKLDLPTTSNINQDGLLKIASVKVMPPVSGVKSLEPNVGELIELPQIAELEPNGYLARVLLNSPEDVNKALLRAEELFSSGKVGPGDKPMAFVLHGPEVKIFFKDNYEQYRSIVDLAAKLTAFNVVNVKVCRTRMRGMGERESTLVPFVGTVPYGPAEIKRLVDKERYVYF